MPPIKKFPVKLAVPQDNGKFYVYGSHITNFSEVIEHIQITNDLLETNNALLVDANGHLVDANGHLVEIDGELVKINTVEGEVTDAAVTGDNDGTISAKLRGLTTQTVELLAQNDDMVEVQGTVEDAAVIGDNPGTLSGKLRGITTQNVSLLEKIDQTNNLLTTNNSLLVDANGHLVDVNGNLVEIEGQLVEVNTVEGSVTDAAVTGDNDGTISAKLRGLSIQLDKLTSSNSFATGQVALATTASQVAAERTTRRSITIVNTSTIDVYVGGTGVTTTTGQLLLGVKGASLTLEVTGAIHAIATSGTPTVTFVEEYNV